MSVTFTASANATPASGTVVATCVVGGENYQLMILTDAAGNSIGVGPASPLVVSACITNLAGSAAGSPLFVTPTNIPGSAIGAPIFSSLTNIGGSAIGSPFFVSEVRGAGSAAGSPLFVSACVTNSAGSAAGSPLFSSITNLAGSAAGSPLFVRVGDGTDTVFVDAACRLAIALTDGTNAYGLPGSPLSQAAVANQVYWSGSLLTVNSVDLSASAAGCTLIVASAAGQAIVIVSATFTTSSCQRIGWTACGNNGGASATVQTPMPFGTNGGMDANRLPHGHLWTFPSGSKAVLTTTSACYVAGTLDYLMVAS